uniref:Uncharacterized protein n=1 Tax=Anguilla anguilla TaxID=7936 RepID=A0A0E9TMQ6_ANGAN
MPRGGPQYLAVSLGCVCRGWKSWHVYTQTATAAAPLSCAHSIYARVNSCKQRMLVHTPFWLERTAVTGRRLHSDLEQRKAHSHSQRARSSQDQDWALVFQKSSPRG